MLNIVSLNLMSFLLSLVLLGYSAYSDLRTREVSDWVWIIYLPVASILFISRILLDPKLLVVSLVSVFIMIFVSFLMFYIGFFGGADFKAFICLGVALPINPFHMESFLPSINPIFPLIIFYNAYLFSGSIIFYNIFRNINWKIRKGKELFKNFSEDSLLNRIIALLSGYKNSFEALTNKIYLYPMEEISEEKEESHRRLKFFTNAEADRIQLINALDESLKKNEKEAVWVTPGIPLLFFVFVALISSTFIGDILLWIVFQIISVIF